MSPSISCCHQIFNEKQDRGQKDKGTLGRRKFTQTQLSLDCQIIISLLNSWSVSIITEAAVSIFVKWAD